MPNIKYNLNLKKKKKQKKKNVAQIRVDMIFFILMLASIHSNLLALFSKIVVSI